MTTTRRIDVSDSGAQANNGGGTPGISADGRYIAYFSKATNLVAGDTNNTQDVFVYDRVARTVVRVSVKPDGSEGFPPYLADFGGEGLRPALSADGRFVAFFSFLELVPGDTNIQTDIYVHDRDVDEDGIFDEAGATDTDRVSVASDGSQATPYSNYYTDISADGRYVTFASDCNNLVTGDTNGRRDVFVHDRDTDGDGDFDEPGAIATRMVSVAPDGTTPGNEESTLPRMSADGRYISFIGGASNLVSDDLNGRWDAFIRDRDVDQDGVMDEPGEVSTVRASIPPGGGEFNVNVTYAHDLSSDGSWFAFEAPDAPSGAAHIQLYTYDVQAGGPAQFIRDLGTVSTIREMAVNGDGSSIVTNMGSAVTLVDRVTTATEAISTSGGSPAPGTGPAISDDARFVAFASDAQLIPGDTNGQSDVFLRDRNAPPLVLPAAPVVIATPGDGSASLSWTAPDDGGSPVQHYYVTPSPPDVDPFYVNAPNLGTTISGLTPGRTYTFTVSAITAVGTGPAGTSNPVTPSGTQRFGLQVALPGSGTGAVQSSPTGIDCGTTCAHDFNDGTVVTLTAMPDMGSTFEGWGGACSGSDSCQVTMDQARQVTATFEALPPLFPGFSDDFGGTTLNATNWNTTIATSGVRWCPTTQANHLTVSGQWQDVSSIRCNTALAPAPHGSISVTGGTATLSAGSRATFPYIWRGRPSRTSPFPSTGAFVLEVRMRFPSLAGFGTELNVGDWPNTDPVGDNPPGTSIFSIGACGGCGLVTNLLGTTATVAGPTAFHDYRLEYVNGRYSLWVDGVRTMGPVGSPRRPDSLWVGNPVMTFWGTADWTDLSLDSVLVSVQRYPLTFSTDGTGAGTITSDLVGADCGPGCQQFNADTEVTLTATPSGTSAFAGWSGGGCPGTGTCVVTMDQARNVTATFGHATRTLTVSLDGTGGGSVTSSPAGIDCGPTCSADFADGVQVTLTAVAGANASFTSWSGAGCSGSGDCVVTMDQVRSVTATFSTNSHRLDVTKAGNGGGTVTSTPAGIDCGPTCSGSFGDGTLVTLSPAAESGSVFEGWSGDCSGKGTCTISLSQARSVTATFVLIPIGQPWGWGWNINGQVGDPACSGSCSSPVRVNNLSRVTALAAGNQHSLALRDDGTVWAWGDNSSGQLGNSVCSPFCATPVQTEGLTDVVAVSAGASYSLALRSDGTVWMWGRQLGGQCSTCNNPTRVGPSGIVAISAGYVHALALRSDGTVWAWGYNGSGTLGSACLSYACGPVQVAGLTGVVGVAAGSYHSLAIRSDGTVHAWGDNTYYALGVGSGVCYPSCSTPVQVPGLTGIEALAAGYQHSFALRSDGTVWAWGYNQGASYPNNGGYGYLGLSGCSTCPVTQVNGLEGIVAIETGESASMALRADGTAWGWGYNALGMLGIGSTKTDVLQPTKVVGLASVDALAVGTRHSLAIASALEPLGETVTVAVPMGGPPVTTDVEGDGATPSDPVETEVALPSNLSGTVTIEDGPSEVSKAQGFSFFGEQMIVTAPQATTTQPLELVFRVDATAMPAGQTAQTLAVFKNGNYVLACSGPAGTASPDPCVSLRETLSDGDARITVLTSDASQWNLGFAVPVTDAGGPYAVQEGSTVELDATASSSGVDPLSFFWFPDFSLDDGTLARPSYTGLDDGSEQLMLTVTDATGLSAIDETTVTVTNADPSVAPFPIIAPRVGQTLNVNAAITDAGTLDTHTAVIDWGDGTTLPGTVTEENGSGSVTGAHVYAHTGTFQVTVTVTDDDGGSGQRISAPFSVAGPLPTINIGTVSPVTERNSGTTTVRIPVTLSAAGTRPIDVRWSTGGGTASPGSDYVSASGTLHWNAGSGSAKQISISIRGDVIDEPNQTFIVTLSAPVNATIGTTGSTVTIADDDAAPRIAIADSLKLEGASGTSQMVFIVALDRRSEFPVTVSFSTVDGTARAGADYLSRFGVLTFAPGITSLPLAVTINGDRVREPNERFTVGLSGPTNSSILRGTATGTIVNDD